MLTGLLGFLQGVEYRVHTYWVWHCYWERSGGMWMPVSLPALLCRPALWHQVIGRRWRSTSGRRTCPVRDVAVGQ